jgi:hypothetical protein
MTASTTSSPACTRASAGCSRVSIGQTTRRLASCSCLDRLRAPLGAPNDVATYRQGTSRRTRDVTVIRPSELCEGGSEANLTGTRLSCGGGAWHRRTRGCRRLALTSDCNLALSRRDEKQQPMAAVQTPLDTPTRHMTGHGRDRPTRAWNAGFTLPYSTISARPSFNRFSPIQKLGFRYLTEAYVQRAHLLAACLSEWQSWDGGLRSCGGLAVPARGLKASVIAAGRDVPDDRSRSLRQRVADGAISRLPEAAPGSRIALSHGDSRVAVDSAA